MFSPLEGDDYIVYSDDVERTQASFARFNQRDAAIYPEFNAYLYEAAAVIRKLLFETPPDPTRPDPTRRDWKTYKQIGSLLWKYRKIGGKLFQICDVLTMSADDYLRRWFEDAAQALEEALKLNPDRQQTRMIINARRHPLDSCFGSYKQLFAQGQPFSYDLVELGEYSLQYQRLMDHWHEVLPGKVLDVQ